MIKDICKQIFRSIFTPIFLLLFKSHILTPRIIVKVDGGICSQMHFYLIGSLFKEKGYKVEYDLSWYVQDGFDMTGKFCRNFDLLKLFPNLQFKRASLFATRLYRCMFSYVNDYFSNKELDYLSLCPPRYLAGYYKDPKNLYQTKFKHYFPIDNNVLDKDNLAVLCNIQGIKNSVAIHVRRGDLSAYLPAYGYPASTQYFITAIEYLNKKYDACCYFIFSDEPEWCKNNLINYLPSGFQYKIVDLNGSDKGYMDLILIANCRHQITSKGSLGKYGALLKQGNGEVIICNDDTNKIWESLIPNSVLIPS